MLCIEKRADVRLVILDHQPEDFWGNEPMDTLWQSSARTILEGLEPCLYPKYEVWLLNYFNIIYIYIHSRLLNILNDCYILLFPYFPMKHMVIFNCHLRYHPWSPRSSHSSHPIASPRTWRWKASSSPCHIWRRASSACVLGWGSVVIWAMVNTHG